MRSSIKKRTGYKRIKKVGFTNIKDTITTIDDSIVKEIESEKSFENGTTSKGILTLLKSSLCSTKEVVIFVTPLLKYLYGIKPAMKNNTHSVKFAFRIIGKTKEYTTMIKNGSRIDQKTPKEEPAYLSFKSFIPSSLIASLYL